MCKCYFMILFSSLVVGFCDLEGMWYNECNDQVTITKTSTGMMLGDYMTYNERAIGYAGKYTSIVHRGGSRIFKTNLRGGG